MIARFVPTPLITALRVRYVECDMQGHAFNAHYLTWFDLAHTEALRAATGLGYHELLMARGVDLVVAESNVRHLAPARYDDVLEVETVFGALTTSSLTSQLTIRRDGATIAAGSLRHVCVETDAYTKSPWPDVVRAALAPYVTGPPAS
jgi:acyl-CoA thioester hydrolase